ncbi:MAG: EAL domain-containing protein [Acidimicrobiia bacterium]|nr:EAL domain-containing protein [Acidimicrobiia bacterium]
MNTPSNGPQHDSVTSGANNPFDAPKQAGSTDTAESSWLPAGLAMHFSEDQLAESTSSPATGQSPPASSVATMLATTGPTESPGATFASAATAASASGQTQSSGANAAESGVVRSTESEASVARTDRPDTIPPFEPAPAEHSEALLSQLRASADHTNASSTRLGIAVAALAGLGAVLLGGKAAAAVMLVATLATIALVLVRVGLTSLWVPVASGTALTGAAIAIGRLRSDDALSGPVPLIAVVGVIAVTLLGWSIHRIGMVADAGHTKSGRANAILVGLGLIMTVWGLGFLDVSGDDPTDQWWLFAWGVAASICAAWIVRPVLGARRLPSARLCLNLGGFAICAAAALAAPQLLGDLSTGFEDVALTLGLCLLIVAAAGGSILVDEEADDTDAARSLLERSWLVVMLVALVAAPLAAMVAAEQSVSTSGLRILFAGWAVASIAVVWAIVRARQAQLERTPLRDGELVARLVRANSAEDRAGALLNAVDDTIGQRDGKVLFVTQVDGGYAVTAFLDRSAPERVTAVRHGASIEAEHLDALKAHEVVRFDRGELPLDARFRQASGVAVSNGDAPSFVALAQARRMSRSDRARLATVGAAARETAAILESQASDARARGERRFRTLIEHAQDIVAVVDEQAQWNFVSPAAERLLRSSGSRLVGQQWLASVLEEDRERSAQWLDAVRSGEPPLNLEVRLLDASGVARWFEISGLDLRNEPEIGGIVLNARETTLRRRAEAKRLAAEARFRALVQTSGDAVGVLDAEGRLQFASSAVSSVLGVDPARLVGRHLREFAGTIVDADRELLVALSRIGRSDSPPADDGAERRGELVIRTADGEVRVLDVSVQDERNVEAIRGFVIAARDVTGHRAHERSTAVIGQVDPETGLATRAAFGRRVLQAVQDLGDSAAVVGVAAVEFAGISTLDERLHEGAANRTMIELTRRLRPMLTPRDVVARVGRDTVAVLLVDRHARAVQDLVPEIRRVLSDPVVVRGAQVRLHVSVGVAIDHGRGQSDPLTSYQRAMNALEASRQRGGETQIGYANEPFDPAWGERLTQALDHNEFEVWYHPVVDIATGQVAAVEALARWRHPERGVLTPADFFEVVYRAGFIAKLGSWVSARAVRDLSALIRRGANISLALNTSEKELRDVAYVQRLADALAENQLSPSRLMIEVPERAFLAADRSIGPGVRRLRALGVVTALDDFVGGPEALAYARQAGFDVVKVDRRAVASGADATDATSSSAAGRSGDGARSDAVLSNLMAAAATAGIEIMIEGVEDQGELATLRRLGLRHAQGYLFAKPMPLSDLINALQNWPGASATVDHAAPRLG